MRLVEFTDRETGVKGQIRALKHPMISEFEILLPYSYRMLYAGFEGWSANRTDLDFDEDSISKCDNRITIVNMNPKPIDYILFVHLDREQAIEAYKHIIANCSVIVIELNDDKSLYDVQVNYITNCKTMDQDPHQEEIYLIHEDDKYDPSIIDLRCTEY